MWVLTLAQPQMYLPPSPGKCPHPPDSVPSTLVVPILTEMGSPGIAELNMVLDVTYFSPLIRKDKTKIKG